MVSAKTKSFSPALRVLVAVAVVLATGNVASASRMGFGGIGIRITADGVFPRSLHLKAMNSLPFWVNEDAVAHAVTFDDGRCAFTIPAGGRAWCERPVSLYAGTYRYRVSRLVDPAAEIVVLTNERRVTMVASRATARAGQVVTLRGTVFAAPVGPLAGMNMPQTVTLLRRVAGSRRFVLIRRVRSGNRPNEDVWSATIRPRATASYIARIVDRPAQTVWERAESRRVVVRVIAPPTSR
jgi:hypothetical protein